MFLFSLDGSTVVESCLYELLQDVCSFLESNMYVTIPMDFSERMPAPSADDQISWSPLGSGRDAYLYDVMMRRLLI